MPLTLDEFKQKWPQYVEWDNRDLANALHEKYYSKIPRADFLEKVELEGDFGAGFVGSLLGTTPLTIGRGLEAMGLTLGSEDLEGLGSEFAGLSDDALKRYHPRIGSFANIKSVGDLADYLQFQLGAGLGSMVPPALGALGLGAVGGLVAGPPGAVGGALLGAGTPSYLQNSGEVFNALLEEGKDQLESGEFSREDFAQIALMAGGPMAALDMAGLYGLGRMFTKQAKSEVTKRFVRSLLRGGLRGGLIEGTTEALQESISQTTTAYFLDNPDVGARAIAVGDAFVGGFLPGGVLGGVSGAVGVLSEHKAEIDPQAPPVAAPVPEVPKEPAVAPIAGTEGVEVQPEVEVPVTKGEAPVLNARRAQTVLETPEGRSIEELGEAELALRRFTKKQLKQNPKSKLGLRRQALLGEIEADRVMGIEPAVQPEVVGVEEVQPVVEEAGVVVPEGTLIPKNVQSGLVWNLGLEGEPTTARIKSLEPAPVREEFDSDRDFKKAGAIHKEAERARKKAVPFLKGLETVEEIQPEVEALVTPLVEPKSEVERAPQEVEPVVLPEGRAKGLRPERMSLEDAQRVAAASEQEVREYPGFVGSGKGGGIVQSDKNRALGTIEDALESAPVGEKAYLETLKGQVLRGIRKNARRSDKSGAEQILEGRPEVLGENLPWGAYDGEEKFWEFMETPEVLGILKYVQRLNKEGADLRVSKPLSIFILAKKKGRTLLRKKGMSEEAMQGLWNEAKALVHSKSGHSTKDISRAWVSRMAPEGLPRPDVEIEIGMEEQTDEEIARRVNFAETVGGLITGRKVNVVPFWWEDMVQMLAPYVQDKTLNELVEAKANNEFAYGIQLQLDNVIAYSMDINNDVLQHVVPHEAWHWLQKNVLTNEEKQVLADNWDALFALANVETERIFGMGIGSFLSNYNIQQWQSEVEAVAAGAYFRLKAFDSLVDSFSTPLQKVFNRLWSMIMKIGEFFNTVGMDKTQVEEDLLGMMPREVDDILMKGLRGELAYRVGAQKMPLSEGVGEANSDAVSFMLGPKFDKVVFDRALKGTTVFKRPVGGGALEFVNWGDLTRRAEWVLFPRMIASRHREFAPVYNSTKNQRNMQNTEIANMSTRIRPYGALAKSQKKLVDRVLELGRLMGTWFVPDEEGVLRVRNELETSDKIPVRSRLSGVGDELVLDGPLLEGYLAVRDWSRHTLDRYREVTLGADFFEKMGIKPHHTVEMLRGIAERAVSEEQRKWATRAADASEQFDLAKESGYVPFSRVGDHYIVVQRLEQNEDGTLRVDKDGQPVVAEKVAAYFQYESTPISRGMRKIEEVVSKHPKIAKLLGGFGDVKINDAVRRQMEEDLRPYIDEEQFVVSRPRLTRDKAFKDVQMDYGALEQMANSLSSEEAREEFKEAIDKLKRGRGFGRHFLQSKNVPGYSVNFERSISDYSHGLSTYMAFESTKEETKRAVESIEVTKKPQLRKYAERYVEFVQSPKGEFARWRQLGFFWYLGGNFSSSAVNLTQSLTHSWPWLSQLVGPVKAATLMLQAAKDVSKVMFSEIKGRGRLLREREVLPKGSVFFNAEKMPEDVRGVLVWLARAGVVEPLQTFEITGMSPGPEGVFKKRQGMWRQVMDIASLMFANVEIFNRAVIATATARAVKNVDSRKKFYEVMKGNALVEEMLLHEIVPESVEIEGKKVKLDREQAIMVNSAVEDTQFENSRINRARLHRGAMTAVMQFQGFPWQSLELMWRLATAQGTQGKKAFAMMMGTTFMLAGLWGLPFFDDLKEFYEGMEKFLRSKNVDLDGELRELIEDMSGSEYVAEAFVSGGSRAVVGADMSRRFGFGDILPNPDVTDLLGVPGAMLFGNVIEAMERWQSHQGTLMSLSSVMPMFIKNLIKGWELRINRGVLTKKGQTLVEPGADVSTYDWVIQKLGFTPADVARRRDISQRLGRIDNAVQLLQTRFYAGIADLYSKAYAASAEGDNEAAKEYMLEAEELWSEILEHNQEAMDRKQYEALILIDGAHLRSRIAEQITGVTGPIRKKRVRKAGRAKAFEMGGFVQP